MIIKITIYCLLLAIVLCPKAQTEDLFEVGKFIGSLDAVAVADPNGNIIYGKNVDQKLIPASALKVFTALTALHYLGPDYRFSTEFYQDDDNNLIIKGYGDPLLISEIVEKIAIQIAGRLPTVADIVLDDTFFAKPIDIPGASTFSRDPYNAPNGALCVNFNTVHFARENGVPVSAESQTPMLPLAVKQIRDNPHDAGRITLSFDKDEVTVYAGEMFMHFFRAAGMNVTGELRLGRANPPNHRLIYRYTSEYNITDIIERLLTYSNNYIANQLLIAVGAFSFGPPGTLEKGVAAANGYANNTLGIKGLVLVEGSGLSRNNLVSAGMFCKMLDAFASYHMLMSTEDRDIYKTGTLSGIRTRVGYIRSGSGDLYRYAILLNTPGKTVDPIIGRIISRLDKSGKIDF